MYGLLLPLLLRMDAERAHATALRWLDRMHVTGLSGVLAARPPQLPAQCMGLAFPNPVGLAAGLDKNGEHVDALFALGFGFVEVGTVTPRPQPGNPAPRLFRLPEHRAIINRMGFNNAGVDALVRHVARARRRTGPLGINIGKNRDTSNDRAIDDYRHCLRAVHAHADYVTVNLSSPNTAGLRDLQQANLLRRLIAELRDEQQRLSGGGRRVPLLVKVAPDLTESDLDAMAQAFNDTGIDGVIATNTTVARDAVVGRRHAHESGGLSGAPLLQSSTDVLHGLRERLDAAIPLVGVGGILCGDDALRKRDAGAALVQLYTGLIYRGPALIGECGRALAREPAP